MRVLLSETDVIAPNFKRRLSGVTSTIVQLVPFQRTQGVRISAIGFSLPDHIPLLSWSALVGLWKAPLNSSCRVWHARRNIEMIAGVLMRDILRMKLRLVFTSAAQRYHKTFTKLLIRRMDQVIATSKRSGAYLEVPYRIIMHGVDLERFTPPLMAEDRFKASNLPGEYAVGCFGRIRYQKGTDLFVAAMIALLPYYPQWTAVIAGRVTFEHKLFKKKLKNEIVRARLAKRIVFLGELSNPSQWYRRLTLYVAPSRNEGFGLTPLEAMASETAVVTSDAGVYSDIVTENVGTVCPSGDGMALQQAIESYFVCPARTIARGKRALVHVRERFSIIKEASAIRTVYQDILYGKEL
ncbi:MAG: mannosyltransferase [Candidatus Tokpelaia sp. JSC161]|jgi:mannosyltransferase|nr:MAG: mannosyltransferase [Candidatus Tokpelaia sp. JSC161]